MPIGWPKRDSGVGTAANAEAVRAQERRNAAEAACTFDMPYYAAAMLRRLGKAVSINQRICLVSNGEEQ